MKELSWENGIRLTQVLTSQHRFLRKAERQTVEQSPALELQSDEQRRGGLHKIAKQSEEGRPGPNRECVLGNNGAGGRH